MKDQKLTLLARTWRHCTLIRLLVTGAQLLGCSGPTMALTVSGPGFTHLGQVAASSTSDTTDSWFYAHNTRTLGLNLILSATPDNWFAMCDQVLPNVLTPDGNYYGWELSPGSGVYGVIYDSSVTTSIWLWDNKHSMTATWSANGRSSTGHTDGVANCFTSIPRNTIYRMKTGENTLNGQLKYGVYVDSIAPLADSYTLRFYIGKYRGSITPVSQAFTVNLTACTVTAPSKIRFGNVDAGVTAPVISSDDDIKITCSGLAPSVNVSYTAQAISATQSQTELVMSNSQNQTLGTVRGFIGTNADSEAGCNNAATSVHFGAPAQRLLKTAANNRGHIIPLKWVFCPVSSAPPGEGTASATLDIIWQ